MFLENGHQPSVWEKNRDTSSKLVGKKTLGALLGWWEDITGTVKGFSCVKDAVLRQGCAEK